MDAQQPTFDPTELPGNLLTPGPAREERSAAGKGSPLAESPGLADEDCPTAAHERPTPPLLAGSPVLGKYQLLDKVAQGGMGVIYRAHDTLAGRVVALKVLQAGEMARAEEVVRFLREARAAGQLHHPNIVPIYEIGQEEGRHYYTMPFVAAGCLRRHMPRLATDLRVSVALVEKIARAVQHAHEQGILHRDLKPANVLLASGDQPLVSDFGLAKFLDASADLTHSGQVLGTPAYMAPEQAAGQTSKIGPRTDIWALGVILYELVTGRRPFPGENREEVIRQILTTEPPRPRTLRPDVDARLETIVRKCLEKDPAERYTGKGLAEDLGRWLRGEALSVRPRSLSRRLGSTLARSKRIGLAVLVGGLTLAAALLMRGSGKTPSAEAPVQALQRRLEQGKPVTLIGERGPPGYYFWSGGGEASQLSTDRGGTFSVHSWDMAMLDLLPDPRCRHYRIRAEVRHEKSDQDGAVGIYLVHGLLPTPRGMMRCFCQLSFNDVIDSPANLKSLRGKFKFPKGERPGNTAQLAFRLYGEPEWRCNHTPMFVSSDPFKPAAGQKRQWRKLEVVVGPKGIEARWERKPLRASLRWKDMRDAVLSLAKAKRIVLDQAARNNLESVLAVRGALGLYVYQGSASFRHVVVEPLGQAE